MSHELSPDCAQRSQAAIDSGRYATADEVVRSALAALEEVQSRQAKLQAELRERWQRVKSGETAPSTLDIDAFLAAARQRLAAKS